MKAFLACLLVLFSVLTGCSQPAADSPADGATIVTVVGAVHGRHRNSPRYSLEVLRRAVVTFDPDIILVELPPARFAIASANFERFGDVRESRADDFPELTDVVFPLRKSSGFTMIPVAAWTPGIAANRRAKERKLQKDPTREKDWSEYQAAIQRYNKAVSGRSDDPAFIHSDAYDAAVEARQEIHERLFGEDLGAAGWRATNGAHLANISRALDSVAGQEKRVLILFGAWHKYKIKAALAERKDVFLADAAPLFE